MKDPYKVLEELNIPFEKFEHPAVFTCEEAERMAGHCARVCRQKISFSNPRKSGKFYLVTLTYDKRANLHHFSEIFE